MSIENWLKRLAKVTQSFHCDFGEFTVERLNLRPNGSWSIAQNIDHLIVINSTFFPVFEALKENKYSVPDTGKFDFLVNFFGRKVLSFVKPSAEKRIKTEGVWKPAEIEIGTDIFERFAANQIELARHCVECRPFIENGVIISSPANRFIVYKLEMAFEIIVTHEERHLKQARQIAQTPLRIGEEL